MNLVEDIMLIFIMKTILFLMRERVYIDCGVYRYDREGMYVNTPGVGARVEYPRQGARQLESVPHYIRCRTCDG